MEDSGYFSHCSSEFRFSDSSSGGSSRRFIPTPEDIFKLNFDDLNSSKYSYFRYGFADEDDFEDFKKDLSNFRRLRRETREIIDGDPAVDPGARQKLWEERRLSHNVSRDGEARGSDERGSLTNRDSQNSGRRDCHDTSGYTGDNSSVTSNKPGVSPILRSGSLRGGGADRHNDSKRNGVCFDDDDDSCFLEVVVRGDGDSPPSIRSDEDKNVRVVTAATAAQQRRKPGKRVSFRESPETFPPPEEDVDASQQQVTHHEGRSSLDSTSQVRTSEAGSRPPVPVKRRTASDSLDVSSRLQGKLSPILRRAFSEDQSRATRGPVTIPIRIIRTANGDNPVPTARYDRSQAREGAADKTSGVQGGSFQQRATSDKDIGARGHDPPKRFSFLGNLKRQERPRSGRLDAFMEFFNGDEHFQEFERVFETINNHRLSRDLDPRQAGLSWSPADVLGDDDDDLFHDDGDSGALPLDDTFSDFFEHDEDFVEFERELEKIRSNRRSRLLESLNRKSNCDIFSDVKAFCDRTLQEPGQSVGPPADRRASSSSVREAPEADLWNSAEEWEVVMNRLKRSSRLFGERAKTARKEEFPARSSCASNHRHSLDERRSGLTDCQYTCHLNCVPSVTLDCTTVSPGTDVYPVATPTDIPSPSASAETSLTDRRRFVNQQQTPSSLQSSQPCNQSSQPSSHLVQAYNQRSHSSCSTDSVPHGASQYRNSLSLAVVSTPGVIRDPLLGTSLSHTASPSLPSSSLSSSDVYGSGISGKDLNQNAKTNVGGDAFGVVEDGSDICSEKDETDSGYRSGTIPDEKLPRAPSQATLNRQELRRKIESYNHYVPKANLEQAEDGLSFQGFLHVTLNLIRPITMELGARPPSIYELLTREHIVEQSTQHIAFYMPRDTVKSIHVTNKTTTREVITGLLKKFHILDNPRKFAMYEQEFNEKNKLVKLKRLNDKDSPLVATLTWDPERYKFYRLVMQENETGEIVWENFSLPELNNFMKVLDREEEEAVAQLRYKYRIMKRIIQQQLKEHRKERPAAAESADT